MRSRTSHAAKSGVGEHLETQFEPDRSMHSAVEQGRSPFAQAAVKGRMRLRLHPASGRNVQDPMEREDSSAAQAEDAKFEDWQGFIIDPAVDAGFGETRRRTAAMPEERIRSNPKIHRRHS